MTKLQRISASKQAFCFLLIFKNKYWLSTIGKYNANLQNNKLIAFDIIIELSSKFSLVYKLGTKNLHRYGLHNFFPHSRVA